MRRTLPPLFTAVQMVVLTLLVGSSVLSAQGSRTRDRTPPTAPTNLVVTATTEHSVSLAWGPSTDNSGSFNYLICCAGTTVTVSQTVTSHTLEGLQPGKTYVFRVYAKDAAGNLSKSSNSVTVTLPGELAAPTKPVVTLLDVGPTHASLSWSSTDDGPTIWYSISIDGQPIITLNSRTATFTCAAVLVPTGCVPLNQETTYTFTVRARDVDGNLSPVSDPVFVTTDPPTPTTTHPRHSRPTSRQKTMVRTSSCDGTPRRMMSPHSRSSATTCTSTMSCGLSWSARPPRSSRATTASPTTSRSSPSIPRTTSRRREPSQ